MNIRRALPGDFKGIVAIHNALHPNRPTNVTALKSAVANPSAGAIQQRWVVDVDGQVVGSAMFFIGDISLKTAKIVINVLPEFQRCGIGSALLDTINRQLVPHQIDRIGANAYESPEGGIPFLSQHGFEITFRERKSILRPNDFTTHSFSERLQTIANSGVEIVRLSLLKNHENVLQELYEIERDAMLDIPGVSAAKLNWPEFKGWKQDLYANSKEFFDHYFVARLGSKTVGLSTMSYDPESNMAYQWLTGVHRCFRRKGIGLLLKTSVIQHTKTLGAVMLHNSTSVDNTAILSLNAKLGFQPTAEWVEMEKIVS